MKRYEIQICGKSISPLRTDGNERGPKTLVIQSAEALPWGILSDSGLPANPAASINRGFRHVRG
jgi:hypothetical protein